MTLPSPKCLFFVLGTAGFQKMSGNTLFQYQSSSIWWFCVEGMELVYLRLGSFYFLLPAFPVLPTQVLAVTYSRKHLGQIGMFKHLIFCSFECLEAVLSCLRSMGLHSSVCGALLQKNLARVALLPPHGYGKGMGVVLLHNSAL